MEEILQKSSGNGKRPVERSLGEEFVTAFMEIRTENVTAQRTLRSAKSSIGLTSSVSSDDEVLLCLVGTVSNTGTNEIHLGAMYVVFKTENGERFAGKAYVEYDETGLLTNLPPFTTRKSFCLPPYRSIPCKTRVPAQ